MFNFTIAAQYGDSGIRGHAGYDQLFVAANQSNIILIAPGFSDVLAIDPVLAQNTPFDTATLKINLDNFGFEYQMIFQGPFIYHPQFSADFGGGFSRSLSLDFNAAITLQALPVLRKGHWKANVGHNLVYNPDPIHGFNPPSQFNDGFQVKYYLVTHAGQTLLVTLDKNGFTVPGGTPQAGPNNIGAQIFPIEFDVPDGGGTLLFVVTDFGYSTITQINLINDAAFYTVSFSIETTSWHA